MDRSVATPFSRVHPDPFATPQRARFTSQYFILHTGYYERIAQQGQQKLFLFGKEPVVWRLDGLGLPAIEATLPLTNHSTTNAALIWQATRIAPFRFAREDLTGLLGLENFSAIVGR
ncbi:hypothetical protein BO79DRAFT_287893 [Aspergillus costaricaensis CBS 115574]|uniref:Uncharacterized protein n=1 Tax=Aspergillus costaricaensis CBS 115574 TaxID=1448317 RepID=A0ACD1ICZ7_9EURO|nr:hypothetical protein BO79DRAFT_287893 [Aspergillus costaricaensis CBS 115574]RAK88438.1 hypothetical protein BO79DRAFT_287893 [Aspergillus costaricaensis CBS 115574]